MKHINRKEHTMDYNKMFENLASMKMMRAELDKEIEAQENEIKELMDKTCVTELIGTEHKATYKEVVSNRFDSTSFKKDHADMYESYKKPSKSMRFTFA